MLIKEKKIWTQNCQTDSLGKTEDSTEQQELGSFQSQIQEIHVLKGVPWLQLTFPQLP